MTFAEYIALGKTRLESARLECADPLLHMKQIVEAALEMDASTLLIRWQDPIPQAAQARVEILLQRRLEGEPFQYIVGYEWFWDSRFHVGSGVLIPRRETECLVEAALECLPQTRIRVAELGAGTGIIGITLLRERPAWEWSAWESNVDSIPFLKKNLGLLPEKSAYRWEQGDFFDGVTAGKFDWFIANPPYVKRGELSTLSKEVRSEPPQALDGGPSGLETIQRLIAVAAKTLPQRGGVLLEIGSDQGDAVRTLLEAGGFSEVRILPDLAGLDRVALGKR